MDRFSDNQPNLTSFPKEREYIIMSAFEEADQDTESHYLPFPDSFSVKLNEIMIEKINECETPDHYQELESQLKQEIISFTGEIYASDEPWRSADGPGVDKFVLSALEYLDDPEGFVQSEQFQDAIVNYASAMSPYSTEKTRDAIGLTPIDLSQKFVQKALTIVTDIESDKWDSPYNQMLPEQTEHGIMVIEAISDMYPGDKDLRQKAHELANEHFRSSVENHIDNNILDMLPEWDEIAIVGFDPCEMRSRKYDGKTENVIEFVDYNDAEDFLRTKMREFIADYIAENGIRLVDECISKNQLLKDHSDRTGQNLESIFLASIMDSLPDYFEDHYSNERLTLLHALYNLVNDEYIRAQQEAEDEEERILGEIADDYIPSTDRSGWGYDESAWS